MKSMETFLEKFPQLTTAEKLEVINHRWLFVNAPESSRTQAMTRLNPLLEGSDIDPQTLMQTMRDVTKDLQRAIEERIARVRVVGS